MRRKNIDNRLYPRFYDNICDIMNIYSISNCWIDNSSDSDSDCDSD